MVASERWNGAGGGGGGSTSIFCSQFENEIQIGKILLLEKKWIEIAHAIKAVTYNLTSAH